MESRLSLSRMHWDPEPMGHPLTPTLSPSEGERERLPPPDFSSASIRESANESTGKRALQNRPRLLPLHLRGGEGRGEGALDGHTLSSPTWREHPWSNDSRIWPCARVAYMIDFAPPVHAASRAFNPAGVVLKRALA